MHRFLQKWGEALLATVCVAAIVFAALYTRQDELHRLSVQQAALSQDQVLEEAQSKSYALLDGEILTGFYGTYRDAASGLWLFSEKVSLQAAPGQSLYAPWDCTVQSLDTSSLVLCQGSRRLYVENISGICVYAGQALTAGQRLAKADATGVLYVSLSENDTFVDPIPFIFSKK